MTRLIQAALLLIALGCQHGPSRSQLDMVAAANGVNAFVKVGAETVDGELLTIDRTGLLLRTRKLVFIPSTILSEAQFPILGKGYTIRNGTVSQDKLETIRLASRFPYGISSDVLARLLASLNQTEIERMK